MLKELSLVKGQQWYVVRYEVGTEAVVTDHIVAMVNNRELGFDWFDAAMLSHQLGQHLAAELKPFLPQKGCP